MSDVAVILSFFDFNLELLDSIFTSDETYREMVDIHHGCG